MNTPVPVSDTSRTSSHSLRLLIVIAALAFSVAEIAYHAGALSGLDLAYTDLWHRLSGVRYQPQHAALVEVDEPSLTKHDDPLAFWAPLHARALATLREAGASVIGVDFLFSITPESWLQKYKLSGNEGLQNYDLRFRQELNTGKVVLAGAISRGKAGENDGFQLPHMEYLLSLPKADLESGIGLAACGTRERAKCRGRELDYRRPSVSFR